MRYELLVFCDCGMGLAKMRVYDGLEISSTQAAELSIMESAEHCIGTDIGFFTLWADFGDSAPFRDQKDMAISPLQWVVRGPILGYNEVSFFNLEGRHGTHT